MVTKVGFGTVGHCVRVVRWPCGEVVRCQVLAHLHGLGPLLHHPPAVLLLDHHEPAGDRW